MRTHAHTHIHKIHTHTHTNTHARTRARNPPPVRTATTQQTPCLLLAGVDTSHTHARSLSRLHKMLHNFLKLAILPFLRDLREERGSTRMATLIFFFFQIHVIIKTLGFRNELIMPIHFWGSFWETSKIALLL